MRLNAGHSRPAASVELKQVAGVGGTSEGGVQRGARRAGVSDGGRRGREGVQRSVGRDWVGGRRKGACVATRVSRRSSLGGGVTRGAPPRGWGLAA